MIKVFLNKYLELVKHFIPEKNVQTSVGLDIGKTVCKMAEVRGKMGSYELVSWAIEPIIDGDKKAAIKKILAKTSVPTDSPITSISGKGTLIRYIDMPQMALEDLRKSFALEADKYFPFPSDQIYTDCFILSPKEKDSKMEVLVAASKKELIDERVKLLTDSGLQADFIGLDSIAIANLYSVIGNSLTKEEAAKNGLAILDIGGSISNLGILINRLPRFTRDLFIGGNDFSKSISSSLSVTLDAAEQLKLHPREKLPEVLQAIDSVIMNMVSELRLSFDYFVNERDVQVSSLLITGGGAMLEGLPEVLSKYLEIPVRYWNPLETMHVVSPLDKEEINKKAPRLSVALGLALYH